MSILSQSFVGRRDIFRSMLAGLFPWHHAGLWTSPDGDGGTEPEPTPAPIPAPPTLPPLPWQFDMGDILELGAVRKEVYVDPSTGTPWIRTVPRWEYPEHVGHPQPMPSATRVYRDPPQVRPNHVMIIHEWGSAAAAEHCTRCRICNVSPGRDHGVMTCTIAPPPGRDVSDEDAPTYTQRGQG